MSKIVVIGTLPESLLNFRGHLLRTLVVAGHEVVAMASEASPSFIERLNALGVKFRTYPLQRNRFNPFKDLQTFLALRKRLREIKPDIILSYNIKPIIWGGLASKGMTGSRFYALVTGLGFVFHHDGNFFHQFLTALVIRLYRIALSRASCVIFQNPDNKAFFVSQHIADKDRFAVVNGSGVDLDEFSVKPLPSDGIVFLTIGRLLGAKGFREYAQAAKVVKKRYPEIVFRLVGYLDPSPDGLREKEVREWDTQGWVKFLGETNDVRPFIEGCHVFVLPSYHEGMPRTVLEAMAMGRPILTTDVPGCRETVIPGENGFLVPKYDVNALAERMIWFIEHRDQWNRMGARSRALAEERFDVIDVDKKLMHLMRLA